MAQSTILAPTATTPSTSSVVTVAAGSSAKIGLYVASGELPNGVAADIVFGTPGGDVVVGQLSKSESCMIVPGPASNVRVTLKNTRGQSVGAYSDA